MCPDESDLSAFYDREVPSPWKEKIEKHIAGCTKCQRVLDQYKIVSEHLEMDENDLPVNLDFSFYQLTERLSQERKTPLFHKYIRIPIPVVALLGFCLTAVVTFSFFHSFTISSEENLSASYKTNENQVPLNDIKELEDFIESNKQMKNMVVQLPNTGDFAILGDSELMKSVDYQGYRSR